MSKNRITKISISALALILTSVMVFGIFAAPETSASSHMAPYVQKLEGLAGTSFEQYIDSNVMFQLPEGMDEDREISVIVTFDTKDVMTAYNDSDKSMSLAEFATESEEAKAILAANAAKKAEVLASLDEKGVNYKLGDDYSTLLSGFEIVIKAADYKVTAKSVGKGATACISEEYNVSETQLVENKVSVFETGIFDTAGVSFDGTGMVVAVLDTGLDSNHTAFSTKNFESDHLGLTYKDVEKVLGDTVASTLVHGLSVDDVYINEKVPFGFDYADSDPDVYSTHNNHGTHVSGVIVGKDDTITGVAPNAQLVSMKIFSDVMDTARATWILSALEDCVVLGVDVINMSLGTACGFSRESEEELLNGVYDKIREAGISMVVAASNSYNSAFGSEKNGNLGLTSNPDTGTVGSPSTYEGVMSVASISGTETPYILYNKSIIYFLESTNSAAEENHFVENLLGETESAEYEFVVIPGVGRSADYTGMNVEGKIALVRRGSNTFEEKAIIAQEQGAAGIIIYNNVSGDIKMNVGDATLAVCSISQDDGEMLAATGGGTLKFASSQTSGPFISDFSSWGPTPSLEIKPEITAHGGNILSSVTGGGYERLSGTSMACPNLAGVVILLRQYVVETFPDIADDDTKVAAMVHSLLMSTADIALGENGLPYAVRKQGAGLANLIKATSTTAYIETYKEDGTVMDKAKLELGDDKEKSGVYEFSFGINNFGEDKLSYNLGAYVFTEGVSETKTSAGETTVTEEAYILDGAQVEVTAVENGKLRGKKITVDGGQVALVSVKITLSDSDKEYLNKSFENGMYVEGFITLEATSKKSVDLAVPYLAFYGDWTKAPILDLDYFETHADELDDSIDIADKTMADAYATRPIGGVYDDYVSYLGSYYFLQDSDDITISAERDKVSLSNQEGTIHSLRYIWTGLLRNASKVEVVITDDVTGEVIFEVEDVDVRKSYGDGGATIYPANVEVEFDVYEHNLVNNSKYTVNMTSYLDYEDGGIKTNEKNNFQFPITVDFEAPTIPEVEYYYEYDKTLKKNRLYAKIAVYDNHYAMCMQVGYVAMTTDAEGNNSPEMKAFEQYMTPVYSKENNTTYVTYELTDHIYKIKDNAINKNTFVVTCYDYALNYATYEIGLPDDYTDFYFDGLNEGLTLSPNEVYTLEPLVYPTTEWGELLQFASSKPGVARIVNNKIVAVAPGKSIIKVSDPESGKNFTFDLVVLGEGDEGYRKYDKPVADVFTLDGFKTNKAYYVLDNEEKDIGDTGNVNFFEGNYNLCLYPSENVTLNYTLNAFFPKETTVEFESSNENIVKIDENGNVTGVAEGFASVTIKVLQDGKSTYYSETVSVEVKDPYVTTGSSLTHYYGNGGLVTIPEDLSLTEIGQFAFSNFEYILKTPEELEFDDAETSKAWFIGDNTITKVVIPEGVKKINCYAFANLTALEEIVLPSTMESIEYGAFLGCTSLQKISFSGENNVIIISQEAFKDCDIKGTLEMPSACVISNYAFAGNQNLEGVVLSDRLLSIGQYAFAGCKKLENVTIDAKKVKYGEYAFTSCESLKEFYVNSSVLPEGMFYECDSLEKVEIGPDVSDIGPYAFRDTKVSSFVISDKNKTYLVQTDDHILSADKSQIIAVAPTVSGKFDIDCTNSDSITVIGKGAFSNNTNLNEIVLEDVTVIKEYGISSCDNLKTYKFGALTEIGDYSFFETSITKIPEITTETKLGKYAFSFTDLVSITIPDDMVLPEGIFAECTELEEVVIGNNVTVGKYAFSTNKDNCFKVKSYNEGDEKYFYYEFATKLKSLTIGDNAVIEDNAFANAPCLEKVTLGAGAKIGYMAFYNNVALREIDLSKAISIGDYAFSGDVYNVCLDDQMQYAAISSEGTYMYTYHGPSIKTLDLSSAESVGSYAFAYCRELTDVKFNENITEIPEYAFAGCISLKNVDFTSIKKIDQYAFIETAFVEINLPAVETIGDYAFVNAPDIEKIVFGESIKELGEGVFSYAESLKTVENLNLCEKIGDYAFAYTAMTEADLSGAKSIGKQAFMKEELTPFKVILGENLEEMGDNPFAMCSLEPFCITETLDFNGTKHNTYNYNFDISKNVKVVEGSLYCKVDTGYELVVYAGHDHSSIVLPEDTVRISAMAFAGSEIEMVTMPYSTIAVGHKAFYLCDDLHTVVFGSYESPILEEEFDPSYFESYEHIPGTGDYGTYTDYVGNEVQINGAGIIPYYMWNLTDGMYTNVFYGANFKDYVGYVENKPTIVKPINGINYDSFILGEYFDLTLEGASAPDETTVKAINAIKAIPEKVVYEDRALVKAAREAYSKIATLEQQALVKNYADLISAEQRITALTPTDDAPVEEIPEEKSVNVGLIVGIIVAVVVIAAVALCVVFRKKLAPVCAKVMESVKNAADKAKKNCEAKKAAKAEKAKAEKEKAEAEKADAEETTEDDNGKNE